MMEITKKQIAENDKRLQKIWKYYNCTRFVLLVLFIGALVYLSLLNN